MALHFRHLKRKVAKLDELQQSDRTDIDALTQSKQNALSTGLGLRLLPSGKIEIIASDANLGTQLAKNEKLKTGLKVPVAIEWNDTENGLVLKDAAGNVIDEVANVAQADSLVNAWSDIIALQKMSLFWFNSGHSIGIRDGNNTEITKVSNVARYSDVETLQQNTEELIDDLAVHVKDADYGAQSALSMAQALEKRAAALEMALDIAASWNPEITSMQSLHQNDTDIVRFPKVKTSAVTTMQSAFDGASNLESVADLDSSACTNFNFMFVNCRSLKKLPMLDTSKGTSAANMFEGCHEITDIPAYDFHNVQDNGWGFMANCRKLKKITPQLDFSGVRTRGFENAFAGCHELEEVTPFITPNVPWTAKGMFGKCRKLKAVPTLDWSKCKSLTGTFGSNDGDGTYGYGCTALTVIPPIDAPLNTSLHRTFEGCRELLRVEGIDFAKADNVYRLFYACYKLQYIKILNFGGSMESIGEMANICFRDTKWGQGGDENRQSLVDTLLTDSYDRTAAGWTPLTVPLGSAILARLTDEEKAAITAKGFTLTT